MLRYSVLRRVLSALAFLAFCVFLQTGTAGADVIYQAFDKPFQQVQVEIENLAAAGVTHVLVSPPQKSLDGPEWWKRYQPVDFRFIEGPLGTKQDLQSLIGQASLRGVKIVVDTVLNHMADVHFFPDLHYPQFGPQDFHEANSRACITNFADRYQSTHYWLCDFRAALPDLDTSSDYVRHVHLDYLKDLLRMGVGGFRFDAAVNIEYEYFDWLLSQLPLDLDHLYFGEVVGTSLGEVLPYTQKMRSTDFFLLQKMIRAFGPAGDLRWLRNDEGALGADVSVRFVRNHDAATDPGFFNFADYQDGVLAYSYILARADGIPFIYQDDFQQVLVRAGVSFHREMDGLSEYFLDGRDVCSHAQLGPRGTSCDDPGILALRREDRGLYFLNKTAEWFRSDAVKFPGLKAGRYQEMVYGFDVLVDSEGQVIGWGSPQNRLVEVGPRSALFLKWMSPN